MRHADVVRRCLLASLLLGLISVPAAAQSLLPQSFGGWRAPAASAQLTAEQTALDQAAILREYGIAGVERRDYARGGKTLSITLYRLRDSSGAYGAFTFLRAERMAPADLAKYSAIEADRGLVLVGNLVVEISGLKTASPGDVKSLLAQLRAASDRAPFPTLGGYLPARGMLANSEHYILGPAALAQLVPLGPGDWLGFSEGAEASLARYRINGREATVLLAAYPTPQGASHKLEQWKQWFLVNPAQVAPGDTREPVYARRQGPVLCLVTRSASPALAAALLDQIHYESLLTWNEPSHSLTDPSIDQILVGTIIGTGVILLFTFVAGIGFGGVRLIVKYFFPGKVFDRSGHVEIIQLGLSSKPIEAKDFY